ncbi:MAG: DNA polymerase III subunit beta [Candidatus Magasanikbacteria bacterium CG10_big_fil_rev_8_21_14_0_10_36_32]|uniref:Beta sliding clamp n=1 Tax=Candidatus Magasanikbacteria bacterium CG10_big_fil_rev_8_21_14_0_10_36_32 TaxID=1974646 RepID=A0A2M6W745_9BACT|nr:MAG: DNA polymerase III subunit beta [Candidatus Magasanikbacteria bacterium CG10_big_fil_rev_8_21_14_0_10_36_32]
MKITCTKENLASALSLVSGVATKNINLPILNNVLIKADSQKVEIISTNLELAIIVNIRSIVEKPGSFTVPARTLTDFINLLPDEKIELELKDNEMQITCGHSATKIKGSPADEFPIIPAADGNNGFLVETAEFKKGLSQVLPAVAKNDIRPELSGISFNFDENELIMAATDSYRLAEKKIKLSQGKEKIKIIVPGRTAQEINHILSFNTLENEKNVRILLSENQIVINYDSVQLISRLVEGQYPDYVQIIPKDFKTTAEFSLSKIIKEIKAASLFSTSGVNGINFDLENDKSIIKISSMSTQTGEYNSEAEANIKGENNSILMNFRYILDGLNNLDGDTGILQMINGNSPCIISSKDDAKYLYIVMPIRK